MHRGSKHYSGFWLLTVHDHFRFHIWTCATQNSILPLLDALPTIQDACKQKPSNILGSSPTKSGKWGQKKNEFPTTSPLNKWAFWVSRIRFHPGSSNHHLLETWNDSFPQSPFITLWRSFGMFPSFAYIKTRHPILNGQKKGSKSTSSVAKGNSIAPIGSCPEELWVASIATQGLSHLLWEQPEIPVTIHSSNGGLWNLGARKKIPYWKMKRTIPSQGYLLTQHHLILPRHVISNTLGPHLLQLQRCTYTTGVGQTRWI